jgi:hypothetical protein
MTMSIKASTSDAQSTYLTFLKGKLLFLTQEISRLLLPLYGRIIMIRGPSMPFWLRDDSRYHSDKKKIDCIATKKAHEKETTARNKAGESRLYSYHLIVFKPGTVLDNSVFSSNNTLVINQLSLKMKDNHPENKFAKKVHGMTLWWRIAEAGGTKIRNANSTIDATLLLD